MHLLPKVSRRHFQVLLFSFLPPCHHLTGADSEWLLSWYMHVATSYMCWLLYCVHHLSGMSTTAVAVKMEHVLPMENLAWIGRLLDYLQLAWPPKAIHSPSFFLSWLGGQLWLTPFLPRVTEAKGFQCPSPAAAKISNHLLFCRRIVIQEQMLRTEAAEQFNGSGRVCVCIPVTKAMTYY